MSFGNLIPRTGRGYGAPVRGADRLFDELWSDFARVPTRVQGDRPGGFVPRIDVTESEEEYRVVAELPGLEEDDFNVVLEEDILTLKGEKKVEEIEEKATYRRAESAKGSFVRKIRFAAPLDADNVSARYKNGVLTITLPKPEEARPQVREIEVEAR